MSNPIGTIVQLRALGLAPLGEGNGHATTMARDEGRYDAFRIRVQVPNGVKSDAKAVVAALREFLAVVHS
jgi:hypothetical protein